jgi:hypothetical protein
MFSIAPTFSAFIHTTQKRPGWLTGKWRKMECAGLAFRWQTPANAAGFPFTGLALASSARHLSADYRSSSPSIFNLMAAHFSAAGWPVWIDK